MPATIAETIKALGPSPSPEALRLAIADYLAPAPMVPCADCCGYGFGVQCLNRWVACSPSYLEGTGVSLTDPAAWQRSGRLFHLIGGRFGVGLSIPACGACAGEGKRA